MGMKGLFRLLPKDNLTPDIGSRGAWWEASLAFHAALALESIHWRAHASPFASLGFAFFGRGRWPSVANRRWQDGQARLTRGSLVR